MLPRALTVAVLVAAASLASTALDGTRTRRTSHLDPSQSSCPRAGQRWSSRWKWWNPVAHDNDKWWKPATHENSGGTLSHTTMISGGNLPHTTTAFHAAGSPPRKHGRVHNVVTATAAPSWWALPMHPRGRLYRCTLVVGSTDAPLWWALRMHPRGGPYGCTLVVGSSDARTVGSDR